MDITVDPDLAVVPNWLLTSFAMGVPGNLRAACRAIANHLVQQDVYRQCIVPCANDPEKPDEHQQCIKKQKEACLAKP